MGATFFTVVLLILIVTRKMTREQLGFHTEHLKQNLILGGVTGGLIIAAVPLLDWAIDVSGMGQAELFSGAARRISGEAMNWISLAGFTVFTSIAMQGFLTGYLFQGLLNTTRTVIAIYLMGLIFTLVHFDLQLGWFLLGLVSGSLFWVTGSLVSPLLIQIACHTAGWLLITHHPRVFTLLGFLF